MGLMDAFKEQHDEVHHKGSLAQDALIGAATWGAIKAYESHIAKNGKPSSHAQAVEIIGGLTAAAVTHLVETKGLNAWDAHKQKQVAEQAQAQVTENVLANQYGTK